MKPMIREFYDYDLKGYVKYYPENLVKELVDGLKILKPIISKTVGLQSLTWEELQALGKMLAALAAMEGK